MRAKWAVAVIEKYPDSLNEPDYLLLINDFIGCDIEEALDMVAVLSISEQHRLFQLMMQVQFDAEPEQHKAVMKWICCQGAIPDSYQVWQDYVNWWHPRDVWFSNLAFQDVASAEHVKNALSRYALIVNYLADNESVRVIKPPPLPKGIDNQGSIILGGRESGTEGKSNQVDREHLLHLFFTCACLQSQRKREGNRLLCTRFLSLEEKSLFLGDVIANLKYDNLRAGWHEKVSIAIKLGNAPENDDAFTTNDSNSLVDNKLTDRSSRFELSDFLQLIDILQLPEPVLRDIVQFHALPPALLLGFAELGELNDRDIQTLLREIGSDDLLNAMKSASESLKKRIFDNLSVCAAKLLQDDLIKADPPVHESELSIKRFLRLYQHLILAGKIWGPTDE
jgi:hypothetical protein